MPHRITSNRRTVRGFESRMVDRCFRGCNKTSSFLQIGGQAAWLTSFTIDVCREYLTLTDPQSSTTMLGTVKGEVDSAFSLQAAEIDSSRRSILTSGIRRRMKPSLLSMALIAASEVAFGFLSEVEEKHSPARLPAHVPTLKLKSGLVLWPIIGEGMNFFHSPRW